MSATSPTRADLVRGSVGDETAGDSHDDPVAGRRGEVEVADRGSRIGLAWPSPRTRARISSW